MVDMYIELRAAGILTILLADIIPIYHVHHAISVPYSIHLGITSPSTIWYSLPLNQNTHAPDQGPGLHQEPWMWSRIA